MNSISSETSPITTTTEATVRGGAAARRIRRAVTILIAVLVAMIDWVICTQLVGLDLMVDQGAGPTPVNPLLVGLAPVLSGLSGWALLAILERINRRRGPTIWMIIAIVVAVLSCWSPWAMALSVSIAVALTSMHVLVGATVIIGMMISGARRP
ncbi:DUF6069 family protein [Microlunatus soli]|nr:DUF6069 family protein [Microlunatus soli]